MKIFPFSTGPIATNTYLVVCEKAKKACVIDASQGSFSLVEKKVQEGGWVVENLFLTHSHWDHIFDVSSFKEKFSCKVYVHKEDAFNLEKPGSDLLPFPGCISPQKADFFYEEKRPLSCGEISFQVLFTPGHSMGSVCFYVPSEKILFTGDTLFQGGMGNVSFPFSSLEKMKNSLGKIFTLPLSTTIYPGHGQKSTLENERSCLGIS